MSTISSPVGAAPRGLYSNALYYIARILARARRDAGETRELVAATSSASEHEVRKTADDPGRPARGAPRMPSSDDRRAQRGHTAGSVVRATRP